MKKTAALLALGLALAGCGSDDSGSDAVKVSGECEQAWTAYEDATLDAAASGDAEAAATLKDCATAEEWKAAAEPYQGSILPGKDNTAGITLEDLLDGFCEGAADAPACD